MTNWHRLHQLALADVQERTRRYSFLVTMLGVLFFAYLVITGKYTVQFGDCRTIYDSTWAGTLMAVCSSIMLTLVGFYLVRGSISRDRRTEVGQIVAATPIGKSTYMISKFLSNAAVLSLMMAVLALVAFITLIFRNEADNLDLWAFVSPFIIIALPPVVFVASVAILFDSVRWLRGSAGNVIYLFLAEFCIVFGMLEVPLLDLAAVSAFTDSVRAAAGAAFPGEKIGLVMGFVMFDPEMQIDVFKVFEWGGITWTAGAAWLRLFWIGMAAIVVLISVPFFDRFDPALDRRKRIRKKRQPAIAEDSTEGPRARPGLAYERLTAPQIRFTWLRMLEAELRLTLNGKHWFWYAVAVGLLVAQVAAPFDIARKYLVPASMIWPLVIWSSMGTRELLHNTGQLMFSSPSPLARQFPAAWLTGVTVALASVGCMIVRALVLGEWLYAAALMVAALFVPTAALAMGVWSGSKKLFEVVYLIAWYDGSIDKLTALDLLGTTSASVSVDRLVVFGLLSVVLLMAAFSGRRMQLARP
ncbi:MAG: ABC-2 transporter permease [Candidatus Zixiibacteriota bacterium]|nr:MAG: ABC-2 transporter permease [candidate division Zixibacteria bacterium]